MYNNDHISRSRMLALSEPEGGAVEHKEISDRLAVLYENYLHTPMAICFTDASGNIIDANRSFLDLYGYELDEVKGRNPRILKSGRQSADVYKSLWQSITDKRIGSWSGELINRKKNGDEVYVLLTISSVFRPEGSLIGYVASTLDITKRKDMELELKARNEELEKLSRFKSDMLAIASHDLKAPLSAMISYADLVRENLGAMPSEKVSHYMSRISEYGTQLTTFIGDLLDLAKIEAGRFQIVTTRARLDSVLQGCIEINQAHSMSKGVRIRYYREGRNRTAVIDVMRMAQVFNNILSNAVKFSPSEGEIIVTYRDYGGSTLEITIEDRGPGIPEEDLKAIFDQYYQVLKDGHAAKRVFGAGIGLSVVKNIVELHGGTVRAANLPGTGCRFAIEMPLKTFTSLKGLAVLIYDPIFQFYASVEKPVKAHGIDCFTAVNIGEVKRIIEYENPDIFFVSDTGLSEEVASFLRGRKSENEELCVVRIQDDEADGPAEDGLVFRDIVSPVTDIEVNDVLKEIFMQRQGSP